MKSIIFLNLTLFFFFLRQSFSLDKPSGKKCFMIGARGLSIIWGQTPQYWQWITPPESRYVIFLKILIEIRIRWQIKHFYGTVVLFLRISIP